MATEAQAIPSQVKLICSPGQGSEADVVKLKDAVTPVVAEPWLGVMLKLLGLSARTATEAPPAASRATANAAIHRVGACQVMSDGIVGSGSADSCAGRVSACHETP